jgi:hypothetical protein
MTARPRSGRGPVALFAATAVNGREVAAPSLWRTAGIAIVWLLAIAAAGTQVVSAEEPKIGRTLIEIDCTREYPANLYFECGKVVVASSAAGAYREAAPGPDSRFGYRFAVERVGRPHIAIVRYPDDKTRCMSVSDGTCYDLSIGVFTGEAKPHDHYTGLAQPLSGRMQEIRQVFWPRWKDCTIAFGNTTQGEPAAAARVTICEVEDLAPLVVPGDPRDGSRRSLGISYEDPCSHASDLGALTYDAWLDRMVTFAKHSGMNRLTYPVVWYHGPLYPSETEPANYFDWSVAAANRNLYIRWTTRPEDWVERLLTRFDNENLEFVSQVTYIRLGSLMEKMNIDLAAIRAGADTINNMRADDKVQSGAGDWTGEYNVRNFERQKQVREQGKGWGDCPLPYGETRDGGGASGPIFNPLHPEVQKALLGSVREIATRYGKHPSYKGIHIFCYGSSTLGFGSLRYGYDDVCIRLFEQETGVKVPVDVKLPDRFSKRYAFLTSDAMREKWVAWRCGKITDLIRRMRDEMVRVRPDLQLAVSPNGGRDAGIDAAAIGREPGITLTAGLNALGPCSDSVTADSAACQTVNIFNTWIERWGDHRWWSCKPDDAQARELAVIFGKPAEGICRMGSNYPKDGFWWPEGQLRITPAFSGGVHFMRHYANAVARFDPMVLSRGGLTLDRGHADLMRPFALAYRALPARKFATVGTSTDPVTVRTLVDGGRRYVYLVNREYYPVEVVVRLAHAAGKTVNLSTSAETTTAETWPLTLGPYELHSFALSPEVEVASFTASPPPEVVARLTRDAQTVLAKIRAKQSSGEKLPPDAAGLAAAIQDAVKHGRLAALRQLIESPSVVQSFR